MKLRINTLCPPQRGKNYPPPKKWGPEITLHCIWWWASCSIDLGIMEYPLIAIILRFCLTQSGSDC